MGKIMLKDGKYCLSLKKDGELVCSRYNLPWRTELQEDSLILALFNKIKELEAKIEKNKK